MNANRVIAGVCVLVFLLVGSANGGLLYSNNPYAYDDGSILWKNSVNLSGTLSIFSVDADVDYAVFEPGTSFQDFLDENLIAYTDPTPAGDYVYAYQIENGSSSPGITAFTVRLQGNETVNGPDQIAGTGDEAATDKGFPGTSAKWDFSGLLTSSETSNILFFSSPLPPEYDWGAVTAGVVSDQKEEFPSPSPEPGTLILLGTAIAMLMSSGRVRRVRTLRQRG